jgi:serine/threonine-protein kinase
MPLRGASLLAVRILAIAVSSAVVLALSFYLSIRVLILGGEVTVPDLTGRMVGESSALLGEAGLILEKEGERYDPKVPAGQIISQSPPAGAVTKSSRRIKVVVSLGTEVLPAPDLSGQSERRAVLELDRLGLRLGSVARASTSTAAERIVAQDPPPASGIFRGDRVSLLVSRGPRDLVYVMPDLTGQALERVQRVLGERGLRVSQTDREPSWAPSGTILRQFPLSGYPVSRGDAITVVVSSGPSA